MAYNAGFPMGYQYMMPQQQSQQQAYLPPQMPQAAPQQANSSIIWVQGEAGAKSYLVAPNTTVQLWDSEAQTIYLKSADASGMPNIKILDYVIRDNDQGKPKILADEHIDYATKDDIDDLQEQLEAVRQQLKSIPHRANNQSNRREGK